MNWINKYEVESESGRTYIVAQDNTGSWGCSCPAWTRSARSREDCKHIKAVRAGLIIIGAGTKAARWRQYGVINVKVLSQDNILSMPEEKEGRVVINF